MMKVKRMKNNGNEEDNGRYRSSIDNDKRVEINQSKADKKED